MGYIFTRQDPPHTVNKQPPTNNQQRRSIALSNRSVKILTNLGFTVYKNGQHSDFTSNGR